MTTARSLILGVLLPALALVSAFGGGVQYPGSDLLRAPDGTFYGTSAEGGASAQGTIFRITRDSELTLLVSFTGDTGAAKGSQPRAGLLRTSNGLLWGTTSQGGASGKGTIFNYNSATRAFVTVVEFSGANGANPLGSLETDNTGLLWGTTSHGGASDFGTIFKLDAATGTLTTVAEFTGTTGNLLGSVPKAGLLRDADGILWGTTSAGGVADLGTIFQINPANDPLVANSTFSFTGTNGAVPGASPDAPLEEDGTGALWGTTETGGSGGLGTVFKIVTTVVGPNLTMTQLTNVVNFSGANGQNPKGRLHDDGQGFLYGTAAGGGTNGQGTVFKVNATTGDLTTLAHLTGTAGLAKGSFPLAGLTPDAQGQLWGAASQGGREDLGVFFKIDPATGLYTLLAEPNPNPSAPSATATPPPASTTTGPVGGTVVLKGTAKDNTEVLSVLVSLNGGPFVPATLLPPTKPGGPIIWTLSVTPENGINVVVVKSIDNGGDSSKSVTFSFNYTVARPDLAGGYNGLVEAEPVSTTPLLHSGVFTLKALPTGRFTGKLTMGGLAASIPFTGSFGNDGTLRFGKTGLPQLVVLRKNQPALVFAAAVDVASPPSRQITGTLRENGDVVSTVRGDQALYTNKKNPVLPLLNVPITLLDPATDKGSYTAVLLPLDPATQGLPATDYPPGAGYALGKIAPTGIVKFVGKTADGMPFTASNALSPGYAMPFFAKVYGQGGALCGFVQFEDVPGQSDADAALRWYKLPNSKSPSYRGGWNQGIETDFRASRFVASKISGKTLLGNLPGSGNATLTVSSPTLGPFANDLSIVAAGPIGIGSAPGGATAATNLHVTILATGQLTGSFTDPANGKPAAFVGAVMQKSQTAAGYFIQSPATAAPKTDPKSSGLVGMEAK